MKKLLIIVSSALALVSAVSCNKAALSKSEVEAGFAKGGAVPTVAINGDITSDGLTAKMNVTLSGIEGAAKDSLSIGVLVSESAYFGKSSFTPIEKLENGTFDIEVPTSSVAGKTVYFCLTAANIYGSNSTAAKKVDVPALPFHYTVAGFYQGKVVSGAYGDDYDSVIEIIICEDDPMKCWIDGIDPYYYSKGYTKSKGYNYVLATIDDANSCLIVEKGTDMHMAGRVMMGCNHSEYAKATGYSNTVFKLTESGGLQRLNCFMTVKSSGSPEDAYNGCVYTRK